MKNHFSAEYAARLFLGALLSTFFLPAFAARECENNFFVPADGRCARLPTAELFYYDNVGQNVRSRGTVIMLHANSGNADAFRRNMQAFWAAGYRVIAYDRKNFGRSSSTVRDDALGRPRSTNLQELDDLANYLGVDRFHLIGVAAGAQVALQYAAADTRGRVQSLVLAATLGPPGLNSNEPALAALEADIALPYEIFCPMTLATPLPSPLQLIASATSTGSVRIPDVLLEHKELGSNFRGTDRPGVEEYRQISANARQSDFDGCRSINVGPTQPGLTTNNVRNPNTFAKLSSLISVPTLLIAGTGDVFYAPPAHMKLWGGYIRNAKFVQLDTGHAPQFESPQEFNSATLHFLKSIGEH